MKRFFAFLIQPWFLALLGILVLALIIWFIGPLIAIADYKPLASETVRLFTILVIFILWGLNNLRLRAASQKSDKAVAESLFASQKPNAKSRENDPSSVKSQDEEALGRRLSDAVRMLQSSRFGKRRSLYTLPWYMIIGAPGSGKTTALKNSGLRFPLRSKLGEEPLQGAGGTRYCDWWFTDEAILIDTAGRYTTQDNPKKVEKHAWLGFLQNLKKVRPKRPLNGVIVTISLDDILNKTATQKSLQTTAIKQRIQELNGHLGMELPVYVIFTKADMVAGFNSFFADLEGEELKQPWGFTLPQLRADKAAEALEQFDQEYNLLMERLNNRVISRLHNELSQQRRTLSYEFPRQMQALKPQLREFINNIFTPNQFESPLLLRGLYLVSSTQTNMASQWVTGLLPPDQCAPPVDIVNREPKTFFVNELLQKVIFAEANLATVNARAQHRFRWLYHGALALSTISFAGMLLAWDSSKRLNNDYIATLNQQLEEYKETTGGLENDHDWRTLAVGLNRLKSLATGYEQGSEDYSWKRGLGLYQGHKLGAEAQHTYLKALEAFFMKDLGEMLAAQVDDARGDDEQLYEALKFYLMLYHPEKMETESFTVWSNILWSRALPGDNNGVLRDHLNDHLQVALAEGVSPVPMDQRLVDEAREILIRTPLEQRIYRRLKNDYLDAHQGQFSVADVLGKKADVIFYRRSGKPLDEGVPELFTYQGFHTGFNVQNKALAKNLADEQWIYGDGDKTLSDEAIETVSQRVNEYYFQEYTYRWQELIGDLKIKSFSTVNRGQAVVRLIASSEEPLARLLNSMRQHTALSEVPAISDTTTELADTLSQEFASSKKDRLERLVPKSASASSLKLPGHEVSDNFSEFNGYINGGDGLPMQQLQSAFKQLNDYFQTLAYAGNLNQAAFQANLNSQAGNSAITTVRQAIAEAPPEIQQWFSSVAGDTSKVTAAATQGHMNDVWQTDVVSFFNKALKGRYPIDEKSEREIKLADFAAFFGPGGVLDGYFKSYVEPFVDSSGPSWRWKKNIGLADQSLRFFERAELIRNAYFAAEEEGPKVKFSLKPNALDSVASGFSLETGGTTVAYNHGPVRASIVEWPGDMTVGSKIVFSLASGGTPLSVHTEGEWSWFRLLDKHATSKQKPNSDNLMLSFELNGVKAEYELIPQSAYNPFDRTELKNFSVPSRL